MSPGAPAADAASAAAAAVSVTAVVVTFDRRELLAEALAALAAQQRAPDRIIVVDNASGDGTAAMVRDRFPGVDLLELPRNIGGAGGFSAGTARALAGGP
ncbi:glycosyltransferase, partial [Actinomadura bangladeshensis]|nr:glycosyltransferase [Actinomadura bangladeshensis]